MSLIDRISTDRRTLVGTAVGVIANNSLPAAPIREFGVIDRPFTRRGLLRGEAELKTLGDVTARIDTLITSDRSVTFPQFGKVVEALVDVHPASEINPRSKALVLPAGSGSSVDIDFITDINCQPIGGRIIFNGGEERVRGFSFQGKTSDHPGLNSLYYKPADRRIGDVIVPYQDAPGLARAMQENSRHDLWSLFHSLHPHIVGEWRPDLKIVLTSIRETLVNSENTTWGSVEKSLREDAFVDIADGWSRRVIANTLGLTPEEAGIDSSDVRYDEAFAQFQQSPDGIKSLSDDSTMFVNQLRSKMQEWDVALKTPHAPLQYEPKVATSRTVIKQPKLGTRRAGFDQLARTVKGVLLVADIVENVGKIAETLRSEHILTEGETEDILGISQSESVKEGTSITDFTLQEEDPKPAETRIF